MTEKAILLKLSPDSILVKKTVETKRVIEIALKAPQAATNQVRTPVNLALVIDRSGSMSGEKLEYVKQAALHVVDLLNESDHLAVVIYDDEVDVLFPSVLATASNRSEIKAAIRLVHSGGSTNLGSGWMRGCQLITDTMKPGETNRCLLLTDGLANVGIVDDEELSTHAREISRRGVSTSCFGVGEGFNEHLLEAMANLGGGKFYYIGRPQEIPAIFTRELGELTAMVAHNVTITTHLPQAVTATLPGGWKTEQIGSKLIIHAGDMYSGQESEFYLRLHIPAQTSQTRLDLRVEVSAYGADAPVPAIEELTFVYEENAVVDMAPLNDAMLQRYSVVDVAEAANEALKMERMGQRREARDLLSGKIQENLMNMPASSQRIYTGMSERMSRGMDEADRKASHQQEYRDKKRFNK
ncbi:MAG: hypothetical protein C0391_09390 [Anaerolinea sp.]|nr:hypothetical protein [Anaerolinea sp.]